MNIIKGAVDIRPEKELIEILMDIISVYDFKLQTRKNNGDYEIINSDMPFDLGDADFAIEDGEYKYSRDNKIELKLIDHSNRLPSTDRDNDYEPDEYETMFEISKIIVKNNKIIDIEFE